MTMLDQPEVHWEHRNKHNPIAGLYDPDAARATREQTRAAVVDGYTETPDTDAQRQQTKARGWRHDDQMERLAELRTSDPAAFARMPAAQKVGLGYYLDGKAAAAALGLSTTTERSI